MSKDRSRTSKQTFRERLALRIAPWLYVPYSEHREEAFKMLAAVAYGSRDAIWTSPTTLARVAMDQKWADGYKTRGEREAASVREMQADWFIAEVKRCAAIGMPLGCCEEWPECSHVLAWSESRSAGT